MLGRPHLNDRLWVRLVTGENKTAVTEAIEIPSDNLNIDEWTWNMPGVSGAMETTM
jgi:hypothetical protein